MPPRKPAPDEAEQLRELVREAHEVIKDLKVEVREARAFLKDIVQEVMTEEIVAGLDDYGSTIKEAMRQAVAHIEKEFDELFNTYMGTKGKSKLTLRELLDIKRAIEQIEDEAIKMRREGIQINENDVVPTPMPGRRVHAIPVTDLPKFVDRGSNFVGADPE